jgi:hypothetical protein
MLPIRAASLLLETRFTVLDGLTSEVELRLLSFVDTVVQVSFVSQHRQEMGIRRHVTSVQWILDLACITNIQHTNKHNHRRSPVEAQPLSERSMLHRLETFFMLLPFRVRIPSPRYTRSLFCAVNFSSVVWPVAVVEERVASPC